MQENTEQVFNDKKSPKYVDIKDEDNSEEKDVKDE